MLMVVRVVYAHRLLQDPGFTVEDVAAKLSYKPRSLVQNFKDVFGMSPGGVRVSLTPDEAVAMVREQYFRPSSRPLASVS
jgi:AraC-like DNA-binding protein